MAVGGYAAAKLGAGALGSMANRSRRKKMRRAIEAEDLRQREYYNDMLGTLSEAMGRYAPGRQTGLLSEAIADRQGTVADAITPIPEELQGMQGVASAPAVVGKGAARSLSEALAEGRDRSMKLAANSGYEDANFGNQVAMGRASEKLGRTRMFAGNSLNLLGGEVNAAAGGSNAFDGLANLANLGASYMLKQPTAAGPGFYPEGDAYGPSTEFYKRIR